MNVGHGAVGEGGGATVSYLLAAVANLESLLKERDGSLSKAQSQMRGLDRLARN